MRLREERVELMRAHHLIAEEGEWEGGTAEEETVEVEDLKGG